MKPDERVGKMTGIVYGSSGKITSTWVETQPNPMWPLQENKTRQVRYYAVRGRFGCSAYRENELEPFETTRNGV